MRSKGEGRARSAVALSYDGKGAPNISAKGKGEAAERMLEIARTNDVPVKEDPVLAAALSEIPLGDQVPEALFQAVAEVLAYVYSINDTATPGLKNRQEESQ